MNLETINKWLENEYGVSYTRLEELHDFVIEQDLKHQEEKDKQIEQLTNNWNELEESIRKLIDDNNNRYELYKDDKLHYEYEISNIKYQNNMLMAFLDKMNEIKGKNKWK